MKKQVQLRGNTMNYFNCPIELQRFGYTPNPKDLMIGAGKLYFRRWSEEGNPLVRRHLGNVSQFNVTPTIEKIQKMSSMDAAKELYAEAVKSQSYKATLALDEFNPFNLALGLYGDEGVEVQSKKNVSDEVYTVTLGAPISLPYKNVQDVVIAPVAASPSEISPATLFAAVGGGSTGKITSGGKYIGSASTPYYITITKANTVEGTITDAEFTWQKGISGTPSAAVVVDGAAQSIAEGIEVKFNAGVSGQDFVTGDIFEIKVKPVGSSYIAGVDYIIDNTQLRGGIIPIPDTSRIKDEEKIKVSYLVPEAKFPKVMGGTAKKIEGDLIFIGDPSLGRKFVGEFWHVSITPTGDIGFITDEWASFTLEMTVLSDRMNHPDEPFFKITNV